LPNNGMCSQPPPGHNVQTPTARELTPTTSPPPFSTQTPASQSVTRQQFVSSSTSSSTPAQLRYSELTDDEHLSLVLAPLLHYHPPATPKSSPPLPRLDPQPSQAPRTLSTDHLSENPSFHDQQWQPTMSQMYPHASSLNTDDRSAYDAETQLDLTHGFQPESSPILIEDRVARAAPAHCDFDGDTETQLEPTPESSINSGECCGAVSMHRVLDDDTETQLEPNHVPTPESSLNSGERSCAAPMHRVFDELEDTETQFDHPESPFFNGRGRPSRLPQGQTHLPKRSLDDTLSLDGHLRRKF